MPGRGIDSTAFNAERPLAPSTPPTTFGKYRILERIAVGGMAEIFKARIEGIGGFHRTFAIKRILPHLTSQSEFADMLVDEAKIAGLLSHANIVQILDLGQVSGTYYIAMEYVGGPDLGRVLERCHEKGITLPVPHAVFICIEMLKGLEYAHRRQLKRDGRTVPLNIIHRDISPANVLLSFQGEVKLTDFGIAKASVKALETVSGVIKGRFDYMSPEQATGGPVDQRTDLFATGIVLYEMLAGQHPFRQASEPETIDALRSGDYPPPSEVNPDVPYQLDVILEKALKLNPDERFQSATEMKEALDRFFHDAGFIFSHSTLAAFLKGLFPKESQAGTELPPPPTTEEMETRPVERPTVTEGDDPEDERPTLVDPGLVDPRDLIPVADSPLQRSSEAPPPPRPGEVPDRSRSHTFAPMAGIADESTLIRRNPALDEPSAWSEAETLIKPDPTRRAPVQLGRNQGRDRPVRAEPHRHAERRRSSPARPRRRSQVLYLPIGLFIFAIGALVGFFLGRESGLASAANSPSATLRHPPKLKVELPEGAKLIVDDREVPGPSPIEVPVAAGVKHAVRVELDGYRPIETDLTLDDNDVRILSFQIERFQPRKR